MIATAPPIASFPALRPRRTRLSATLRRMVRETTLTPADFVLPLFVRPGKNVRNPIGSMPGQFQVSVDQLAAEARELVQLGIPAVILFGIPAVKDAEGSDNYCSDGIVPQAIRAIKDATPELVVMSDMCFCEYTDHGHCGVLTAAGEVDNDATLELYGQMAVQLAAARADVVAPSGMMDGQVGAIRAALDAAGHPDVAILAYAAKYASAFYGPFRDAVDSTLEGDRRSYQQDPANRREAAREVALDLAEGADMVMVKPALAYLDVLSDTAQISPVPVLAYQVSGEMAMVEAAAERGWLDRRSTILETLTAIRRAGADGILTYWAVEVAGWLAADS